MKDGTFGFTEPTGLGFHQIAADRRLRCNPLFVLAPKSCALIRFALFAIAKPSLPAFRQIQPIVAPESNANQRELDRSLYESPKKLSRCTNQQTAQSFACEQAIDSGQFMRISNVLAIQR